MKNKNETITSMMQAGNPLISREDSDVNPACSKSMAGGKVHVSFAASSQMHSVKRIMANCQL